MDSEPDRQGHLFQPSRREHLVQEIRRLAEQTLPARTRQDPRYPVRFDHCFKRIAFDRAVGTRWDMVVERPFYRNAIVQQLRRAVRTLRRMVDRPHSRRSAEQRHWRFRRREPSGAPSWRARRETSGVGCVEKADDAFEAPTMLRAVEARSNTSPSPAIHESLDGPLPSGAFRQPEDVHAPNFFAMTMTFLKRLLSRILIGGAVLAAPLVLIGCSGDNAESTSSSTSQQSQSTQQQGQAGQMPSPGASQTLSSSDVSGEQLQTAAQIAMSVRMGMREDQMRMQKEMKQKYGNPQQMDSTQKAQARKEMRRRQMKMRKKQMSLMQEEAENAGMDPGMFRQIMRSAQQDSTLRRRLQKAMKAEMAEQQPQMSPSPNQ